MMSGILSPAFLQAAGQAGKAKKNMLTFKGDEADPIIYEISCEGDITILSTKNGQNVTATYSDLELVQVSIQADANTLVTIVGNVTTFSCTNDTSWYALTELDVTKCLSLQHLNLFGNSGLQTLDISKNLELFRLDISLTSISSIDLSGNTKLKELCLPTSITSLDVSRNTKLEVLELEGCTLLTSLDLSTNTALTQLSCGDCTAVTLIKYPAIDDTVASSLNGLMQANASGGTLYTDSSAVAYLDLVDNIPATWTIEPLNA